MTKAVFATFNGRAFVPRTPVDLPVGTKVAFDVEVEDRTASDALANLLTPEQADEMLAIIEKRFGNARRS